jgi:hypothetical protein
VNEELKRLVDTEAALDDQDLSQVRFGRSRFLRLMGLTLFGLGASAFGLAAAPGEAQARNRCGDTDPCKHCDGAKCGKNCRPYDAGCTSADDGAHCWHTKNGKCCDYLEGANDTPCHCYGSRR